MRSFKTVVFACAAMLAVTFHARAETTAPPPSPAMWKIQNGKTTVYLLGSVHVLPKGFVWRTPAIDKAIAAADIFAFETDLTFDGPEFHYFVDKKGYLKRGQTLSGLLSPEARERYRKIVRKAGVEAETLNRFQPWLAGMVLSRVAGPARKEDETPLGPGVDVQLIRHAVKNRKELVYMESLQAQFDALSASAPGQEIKNFEKMLESLGEERTGQFDALLAIWAKGDVQGTATFERDFDRTQQTALLDKRNVAWIPKIEFLLRIPEKTSLITVGAAHLAGANSVVHLLCAKGWKVERIQTGSDPVPTACPDGRAVLRRYAAE